MWGKPCMVYAKLVKNLSPHYLPQNPHKHFLLYYGLGGIKINYYVLLDPINLYIAVYGWNKTYIYILNHSEVDRWSSPACFVL